MVHPHLLCFQALWCKVFFFIECPTERRLRKVMVDAWESSKDEFKLLLLTMPKICRYTGYLVRFLQSTSRFRRKPCSPAKRLRREAVVCHVYTDLHPTRPVNHYIKGTHQPLLSSGYATINKDTDGVERTRCKPSARMRCAPDVERHWSPSVLDSWAMEM